MPEIAKTCGISGELISHQMVKWRQIMKKAKANVCTVVIGAILMAGVLTGCGEKKNELRIGYFPNITHSQALVMREQESLEKDLEGKYEVKWSSFNAGPAEVEALFAGELDMGLIGPVPAISAYVKSKGEFVIISGAANGGATLIASKESGINSVADLNEKKVAIPQLGNTQHLMLLNLLSKNDLKVSTSGGTVDIVAAANADISNLFDQNQIDAALVPEPWGSIIVKNGSAICVTEGVGIDTMNNEATTVVLVNKDYLENNEEAVQAFLSEYYAATEYVAAGSEEVKQIVNSRIKEETGKELDMDIVTQAFENIEFTGDVPTDSLNGYAQILFDEEYITEMPDENLIYSK